MNGSQTARVLIVHADSLMGKRVLRLLQEQLGPERVIAVNRTEGDETVALKALDVKPGDVVVNAVGLHPFDHDPRSIITHCLHRGTHYVDLCESLELHSLGAQALAKFTRTQPVTSAVVQSCSTIPAMVDVLMPDRPEAERTVLLSVGIRNDLSAALMYGLLRPLGQKHGRGRWWHHRTSRILFDGSRRRYGTHPGSWANDRTTFFCGLDQPIAYWGLLVGSLATRHMSDEVLYRLCQLLLPIAGPLGRLGTRHGSLRLEQRSGKRLDAVVEVRAESNGLDIPALPACWAALALLGRTDSSGAVTLHELTNSAAVLNDLESRGYAVDLLSN